MLVYEGTKAKFNSDIENNEIAEIIENNILNKLGRKTAKNEFRSWQNSLTRMYTVLNDNEIPCDAGVAIEYCIPGTSKRVDFMISGFDKHHQQNVVIVELKQWETLEKVDGKDALVLTYINGGKHELIHPSYQAWSYASLIRDFNELVQNEKVAISPCAFLHNYKRHGDNDPVDDPIYSDYLVEAPVFAIGETPLFRNFIKERIITGDTSRILKEMESSPLKPSKSLQNEIVDMLDGNHAFTMIDDQKFVYEQIRHYSMLCREVKTKKTIIVKGGPGTGKSVVAVNLLASLLNEDQFVQYVSKNESPRNVYSAKLKGHRKKTAINNLFKGAGCYIETESDSIDTLLVDEAHRLTKKTGLFSRGKAR